MEITKLDDAGLKLLKSFEGCRLKVYLDDAGIPTIGYGQTYYPSTGKKVTMNDPAITQQQADDMFLLMVKPFELAVYSTTRDDLTQNQFNACVCLCYNIGTGGFKGSTAHRLINAGIGGDELKTSWLAWSKAGGVTNQGLLERRRKEFQIYNS